MKEVSALGSPWNRVHAIMKRHKGEENTARSLRRGESESKREIELNKNHEKAITRDHIRFPGSNGPKGPYLFGPPPTARPPLLFRM